MTQRRDPALLTRRHRTVGRIAAILEAAASDGGVRLSAMAAMLDAPKSSIHGLLKGLVSVGYLSENNGTYTLGPALVTLLGAAERPSLAEVAASTMVELRDQFDETVMLGHRMGDSIVYSSAVESRQMIMYVPRLHERRPVLPTSMGKVYLAELSAADLEKYLARRVRDEERREFYRQQLTQVAERGVAINQNETVPGVTGVASGIRERGELVGCIAVAGPSDRLGAQLDEIATAVRTAAQRITDKLP